MKINLNLQPELKRYYFGMAALGLVIFGVVLVNILGNSSLRHDYRLESKIVTIKDAVDSYASTQKKLPEILPDAGIKESEGVEYKRISSSRYMLCAVFKTKSDGYTQPDRYYVEDLKSESVQSGLALDTNTHFTNGNTQGLQHEKGYTCIVYEPYQLSDEYLYPYKLCSNEKFKQYPLYGQTVTSVDSSKRQITTVATGGLYDQTKPAAGVQIIGNKTYTLSEEAKIYNATCKEVGFTALKAGDTIEIYQQETGTVIDGVKITYSAVQPNPDAPTTRSNTNR